jgi:transposase, IS5 family
MKRSKLCVRKLRTKLGRVIREIERQGAAESLRILLDTSKRIHAQKGGAQKICSVHELRWRASPKAKRVAK